MINYFKLQSCGNDHLLVIEEEVLNLDIKILAQRICDRHYGIGSDGLIVYNKNKFIFYNQDGSVANLCGNALRCHALFSYLNKVFTKCYDLEVANESIKIDLYDRDKLLFLNSMPKIQIVKDIDYCEKIKIGNIFHIVLFVLDIDKIDCNKLGKILCHERVNVNFAQVIDRNTIRVKTYEKGAGLTLGCCSGAYCTYHMALRYGYIDDATTIKMSGGSVLINESRILGTASVISSGVYYI